jgi:hypothetical protein
MVVWWILLFSMTNYVSWLYYLLVVAILSYGSFFMMYLYLVLFITERVLWICIIARTSEKGFMKDKGRNALIALDDVFNVGVRPRNGDKVHKRNIHCSDGAKYMSYFKVGVSMMFNSLC